MGASLKKSGHVVVLPRRFRSRDYETYSLHVTIHHNFSADFPESTTKMSELEWTLVETPPSAEFAQLHFFSIKKSQGDEPIEFRITVYEYSTRNKASMRFFAQADKQVNQNTAPFTPFGWGRTLLDALSECVKSIYRFPYEEPRQSGPQKS